MKEEITLTKKSVDKLRKSEKGIGQVFISDGNGSSYMSCRFSFYIAKNEKYYMAFDGRIIEMTNDQIEKLKFMNIPILGLDD